MKPLSIPNANTLPEMTAILFQLNFKFIIAENVWDQVLESIINVWSPYLNFTKSCFDCASFFTTMLTIKLKQLQKSLYIDLN